MSFGDGCVETRDAPAEVVVDADEVRLVRGGVEEHAVEELVGVLGPAHVGAAGGVGGREGDHVLDQADARAGIDRVDGVVGGRVRRPPCSRTAASTAGKEIAPGGNWWPSGSDT